MRGGSYRGPPKKSEPRGTPEERAAAEEKAYKNSDSGKMDEFMKSQPKYKSLDANGNGKLDKKYQVKNPENAKAERVSDKNLDKRMNKAKEVGVKDVKYEGDIGTDKNFKQANENIGALQKRAFGTDTSPWAQKLMDQQKLGQDSQMGQVQHEQRTAFNQAQNDLAMQGGLEGGSRERLAKGSARDAMMARQGVFRQGQNDRLSIGINDEAQRMQLQQQLPGMNLQMDQYKTGLAQADRASQQQVGFGNQANNLQEQQFNANLNMGKANQWAQQADADANRVTGVNQYNAGQQNQANLVNQQTLIGNVAGQNQFNQNQWETRGSVLGNSQVAKSQANQGQSQGLLSTIFG